MSNSRGRKIVRIGTRGSLLATTQTEWAVTLLRSCHPDVEFRTVIIQTSGDISRDIPFNAVGTKGMFVKEIEQSLIDDEIDVGIHSLKDMPGSLHAGLTIGCTPRREDPYDAFVSSDSSLVRSLDELRPGAVVGTSSARRRALLSAYRPDLSIQELRGNLDTRLRKLSDGPYDAIVVACAGLNRLGMGHMITAVLPEHICLPAVGQGALALETRLDDVETANLISAIHDPDTGDCIAAERALLSALGGGCSVPIAAHAKLNADQIELNALVASVDGRTVLRASASGPRDSAIDIGREAASQLTAQNAETLLNSVIGPNYGY